MPASALAIITVNTMFSASSLANNMKADLVHYPQGWHFLMVDCNLNEALPSEYFLLDEKPEYRPLFLGSSDDLVDASPYLILLQDSSKDFLDWFQHHSNQWGFIFHSPYSLDEQLPFWQSILEVSISNSDASFLRFYDGSVAHKLLQHANENERNMLFQPCSSIHLQDEKNQWVKHKGPCTGKNPLIYQLNQPWLHLSDQTYAAITASEDATLQEKLQDVIWQSYPEKVQHMPEGALTNLIYVGILQARTLSIQSEKHIMLFVCLMIEYSLTFYQDSKIQQLIKEAQEQEHPRYGEAALDKIMQQFSESDWQRLANRP